MLTLRVRHSAVIGACFAAMLGACVSGDEQIGEVAQNTAPSGFSFSVLAAGSLGQSEVEIKWNGLKAKHDGATALTMLEFIIQPGGHTGWHSHDAIVLGTVVQGTLTVFDGHAPCVGAAVPAGGAFVEEKGHVHIGRNLGTTAAVVRAQFISAPGAGLLVDAPAPSTCP